MMDSWWTALYKIAPTKNAFQFSYLQLIFRYNDNGDRSHSSFADLQYLYLSDASGILVG